MAIFNQNTLTQVSGFDNPIIAGELVWEQSTYWNLAITAEDVKASALTKLAALGLTQDEVKALIG